MCGLGCGCGLGWLGRLAYAGARGQRPEASAGTRRTLGSFSNAAEPPGCMLGSPLVPHPCKGCCCGRAKGNSSCPAISRGMEWLRIPAQPGKRQFIPSSALSRQGFPATSCAPMPTHSHRVQQVPFPWGHPSPAGSRAGACKDYHRVIPTHRATLRGSGGAQGTHGLTQGPVPRCQPCPATRLQA